MGKSASSPTAKSPGTSPSGTGQSDTASGGTTAGGGSQGNPVGGTSGPASGPPNPTTPTTRPHGVTTRNLLQIQWDYPVFSEPAAPRTYGTAQALPSGPLPRDEALRFIARDDPRPLLVVRECPKCNRTDRALLTPGVDNEKTILLSRWFHCVKLAMDVSQPDHPLHALFPRDDAEHLFVSAADGSGRMPLEAVTSRTSLWAAMTTTLARAYSVDPTPAYKQMVKLIDGFDLSDQRMIDLQKKKSRAMETDRYDPAELRRLEEEIESLRAQIARDLERVERLSRADLKGEATKRDAPARPAGG